MYFADDSLLGSKEFMMKVVRINGNAIRFAKNQLLKDEELILEAMQNYPHIILGSDYETDANFILKYIEKSNCPTIPNFLNNVLRNNRDIIWELVKKNPPAFRCASNLIRGEDREIVEYCIQQDGMLLEYVESPLNQDIEIVREAILNNPKAIRYATKFKGDREMVHLAYSLNRNILPYVSKELAKEIEDQSRMDEDLYGTEMESDNFSHLDEDLYGDNDLGDDFYSNEPISNKVIEKDDSDDSYQDRMLRLIKFDASLLKTVAFSLDLSRSFIRDCIRINKDSLLHIRNHFLLDREFILFACSNYSIQSFSQHE